MARGRVTVCRGRGFLSGAADSAAEGATRSAWTGGGDGTARVATTTGWGRSIVISGAVGELGRGRMTSPGGGVAGAGSASTVGAAGATTSGARSTTGAAAGSASGPAGAPVAAAV